VSINRVLGTLYADTNVLMPSQPGLELHIGQLNANVSEEAKEDALIELNESSNDSQMFDNSPM
jgi:hypothetical protein